MNKTSKWYVNDVNTWLTEHGAFVTEMLDNTPTVSFENMYPHGRYKLVELTNDVVAIVNNVFFSVVIFVKNGLTIGVDVTFRHHISSKSGQYRQDNFQSVIITVNDEEKFISPVLDIVKADDKRWESTLVQFVKDFIYKDNELGERLQGFDIPVESINWTKP